MRSAAQRQAGRSADSNLDRDRDGESGVTLIEMMIVLVIIAIVAAVVVPNVIGRPDEARLTVARTDLKSIGSALELYRLDNRQYPTTRQGLDALVEKPTQSPQPVNWSEGGYLTQAPVDPWGQPYVYRSPGESAGFDLMSYGADGQAGGEGLNADISNRDPVRP
ncbi:MAG: type II secretion system major pseudopilin GspG [Rhizobiaceae bacterium]|nr:type II secretion system major pseudopilin GspG [Rhizobiaceae bacterium]